MFRIEDYRKSADYIKSIIGEFTPDILLILGSGLGFIGDLVENPVFVDYGSIPNFKKSTAPGHAGRFVFGRLRGKNVAVMQGRMHYYEGYSMEEVAYALRTVRLLGAGKLIVTNAAGSVRPDWKIGDIMLISDHMRFFADSPLRGENIEEFGPRFFDMSSAYTPKLRELAKEKAESLGIPLREGVYMYFAGPQFETPAEIRAASILGADAIGMSTVPEVTAAVQCGMEILGLSLLTNMAAGISTTVLSGEEVIAEGQKASGYFSKLVLECLEEM